VKGLRFRVAGFGVCSLRVRNEGLRLRVEGLGFRVVGFMV